MIEVYIKRISWFIGLVLLQVLVLNNIHIGGYATPFIYIYFILKFNSDVSRNGLMLWSFFLGLSIDMFANTPGMNAAAAVALAFLRSPFLRLFSPRDSLESLEPGFQTMGIIPFMRYVVVCVLFHLTILLTLEAFSFFSFPVLLIKIISSAILTTLCILAIEGIRR